MNNFGFLPLLLAILTLLSYGRIIVFCQDGEEPSKPFVPSTDPICNSTNAVCREMPKPGRCIQTDPSNNPMTLRAEKDHQRMCCPVWECTYENGSVSQFYAINGKGSKRTLMTQKVVEVQASVSETMSESISEKVSTNTTITKTTTTSVFMHMQSSKFSSKYAMCSSVHCSEMPSEGTCSSMDGLDLPLARKAGSLKPCCNFWKCKHSSGRYSISYALSVSMTEETAESSKSFQMSAGMTESRTQGSSGAAVSCSTIQCADKPTPEAGLGSCESKNLNASQTCSFKNYGSLSYCCPMYECVGENKEVTEYYAIFKLEWTQKAAAGKTTAGGP